LHTKDLKVFLATLTATYLKQDRCRVYPILLQGKSTD